MRQKSTNSGSNLFADLGHSDAEPHLLKVQIVAELFRLCTERKLTQSGAGKLMGISQPEISRMFRGHFEEYSIDRLMNFLTAFEQDVEIVVRKSKAGSKRGSVRFLAAMGQ